jgi:hypothetical protein
LLFSFSVCSCSSFTVSDRYEGVVSDEKKIRVYVRYDEYEAIDPDVRKKVNSRILEKGIERLSDILQTLSEINSNIDQSSDLMLLSVKKDLPSEIVNKKITDERVEAFVDFTIPERSYGIIKPMLKKDKKEINEDE